MNWVTGLEQGKDALTGLLMDLKSRVLDGPAAPHPCCEKGIQITHIGGVGQPHLADSLATCDWIWLARADRWSLSGRRFIDTVCVTES